MVNELEDKSMKEMVRELYQSVIGIPQNPEENGLIGDVKEVKEILKKQNGRIRNTEICISRIIGILVGVATVLSIIGFHILT